jgi:hypothetical protein
MTTQLELAAAPPPDRNVAWLEQLLHGHGRWMNAAEIVSLTGQRLHDRNVRELASASEWIISGQRGYKHIEHATPEEIHHCAAWLRSQAKKMDDRACVILRNAHRRLG